MAQSAFAAFFGIPAENVTVRSPFLGGGFGSKAILAGPQILAILAARMLGRPVKLVLRRDQMFGPVGHRGATRQRVRLALDGEARLTALEHAAEATTSSFDDFLEPAANASHNLYASPAIVTTHTGVRVDTGTPGPMRAPGEASGSAALECAIDEAAAGLRARPARVPPAQLRRGRSGLGQAVLVEGAAGMLCRRPPSASAGPAGRSRRGRCATRPGGWSDGAWEARCSRRRCSAPRPAPCCAATAPRLVETAAADMGQGAWTALAQIAADGLGLHIDQVSSTPVIPTIRTAASPAAPATPPPRGRPSSAPEATRSPGWPNSRPAIRSSPLYGAGNTGVEARDGHLHHRGRPEPAARAMPPSSRAPASRRSRDAGRAPATRRTRRPGRCSRTARSSPRSGSIPISGRFG